ncbi:metal-dependent hydrolase family protein [Arthrobacter cavernae]|uniref:Amidohydrolase family protein n=1 Tax=Arthrobacter cavernae TaxID=2817681 RepID=A0A939HJS6_9MICC|nr:amidohydrolase family protein [Arthrobacter cavernae]MBO1269317.1 amidohydrolase family protein [Arthrobacter cavernae]
MAEFYSAGTVITEQADEVLHEAGVLFDGEQILWVGTVADFDAGRIAPEAKRRDFGPDATVLPGLIDTHVHLAFDGSPDPVGVVRSVDAARQLAIMFKSARELLSAGVTTARDLGAPGLLDITVRDAIRDGLARGPRMVTANAPLTVTGGHCWFFGAEADGVDEVRKRVREARKAGADTIKIMSTGGNMTAGTRPSEPQYSQEELSAIVDEAHRYGMKVASHAHGTEGIRRSIVAGVDSLEHFTFQDSAGNMKEDPELIAAAAAKGIYVCKTLGLGWVPYITSGRPVAPKMLRELLDQGVKVVAGTDSGINDTPHVEYVAGLEAMASLGMSNGEVLASATITAAESLGLDGVTGSLAAGKQVDMIVVNGNPLSDLGVLRNILAVLVRGQEYVPEFASTTTWKEATHAAS